MAGTSMGQAAQEKIEILSVELLDQHRPLVESLRQLSKRLRIGLGWHYLLDLSWILSQLADVQGKRIMDAGAGAGLMQWFLAQQGAQVISVDRGSRADLGLRFRSAYTIEGLRHGDLSPASKVVRQNISNARGLVKKGGATVYGLGGLLGVALLKKTSGKVQIYNTDLNDLTAIPDDSLDVIVAVSSLEHNSPENLCLVVVELMRVLKQGGRLMATLGAARDQDWYHEPSKGWCFTSQSLERLFDLPARVDSNYDRYDQLFASLRDCAELRDHLADFYFTSGDNGMPWGKWDPQYQPVGVLKVKNG